MFIFSVATILTGDNLNFHGKNLNNALQMVKKLVRETGTSVKDTTKCFKALSEVKHVEEN